MKRSALIYDLLEVAAHIALVLLWVWVYLGKFDELIGR